jgi:hypothetical protein
VKKRPRALRHRGFSFVAMAIARRQAPVDYFTGLGGLAAAGSNAHRRRPEGLTKPAKEQAPKER